APAPASEAAPELSNAGGDSATDSLVAGDDGAGAAAIADPQPEPAPPASSPTDPSPAVAARQVGTVVSFTVAPAPAAADAVVKVDGVVRGPAAGSQVVLRPGERRVEILAPGYRPLAFLVDARPDRPAGAPLAVTLEPD